MININILLYWFGLNSIDLIRTYFAGIVKYQQWHVTHLFLYHKIDHHGGSQLVHQFEQ